MRVEGGKVKMMEGALENDVTLPYCHYITSTIFEKYEDAWNPLICY